MRKKSKTVDPVLEQVTSLAKKMGFYGISPFARPPQKQHCMTAEQLEKAKELMSAPAKGKKRPEH